MAKNSSILDNLQFIGVADPEKLRYFLKELDPCFGKHFFIQAEACQKCRQPVVIDGKVKLIKEVCQNICSGSTITDVRNLKSKDVKKLLQKGMSPQEIFDSMVADDYTEDDAREARQILYRRFRYLSKEKGFPVPDLPSLKEFMS